MEQYLHRSDYHYDLPPELIAQTPAEKRDMSRLMVLDRKTGEITHRVFHDILEYLRPGDALVVNDSKVIPARLIGKRLVRDADGALTGDKSEGDVEVLLLKRLNDTDWETIVRPGKKLREGAKIVFSDELTAEVTSVLPDGDRVVRFSFEGEFFALLDKIGETPLPPYITSREADRDRYQTVYARVEGSAAAPTAGLHFTKELLERVREKGVEILPVTLHVGLGTFRPVKEDVITDHVMHSEWYTVPEKTAEAFDRVKRNGGRVIAVGTTSCRTLESAVDENGRLVPGSRDTSIFIYPGYTFKAIDGLITNFHLPESTLIMLVSAFAGREHILHAYRTAVEERYRFFSFGDAMFIC